MKHIAPILFGILFCLSANGQTIKSIAGYVTDSKTGEQLIAATVIELKTNKAVVTNNYGYYSISIKSDSCLLRVSYMGKYNDIFLSLKKDTLLNLSLNTTTELEEVSISATNQGISKADVPGFIALPIKKLDKIPQLMGERDVLKSVQLMPGVQTGSEGSTGMVVWGGNLDQNLILLDGVPVYNPNHILGFFSVFNDDAINTASFYKGDIPARYNGRASSVLDIRMKEGNNQELKCKGSVGTLASKLMLEGPLIKGKSSFLITGRKSYLGLLAEPLIKHFTSFDDANYDFYDITAKVNYTFSDNNKIFFTLYNGQDKGNSKKEVLNGTTVASTSSEGTLTSSENKKDIRWGNTMLIFRWNHIYNSVAFGNLTIDYSHYSYADKQEDIYQTTTETTSKTGTENNNYLFKSNSNIKRKGIGYDLYYNPNSWNILNLGIKYTQLTLSPMQKSINDSSITQKKSTPTLYKHAEVSAYIEDNIKLSSKWKFQIGMHQSAIETKSTWYYMLLPRINTVYEIASGVYYNAAYSETTQDIQLLSHTRLSLSSDLWVPVTTHVKPIHSKQYSTGLSVAMPFGFVLKTEAFYKQMNNLLAYKEGTTYDDESVSWEDQITKGKGHSYGAELLIERASGRLSGWMSCTYSRSFRQFAELNKGKEYPNKYDRPIDLKIVLMYTLNKKIDIGAIWTFTSGSIETVGNSKYNTVFDTGLPKGTGYVPIYLNDILIYQYNALRLPAYHRLDVSANYHFEHKNTFNSTLSIGVYNVYNRKNPYSVTLKKEWGKYGESRAYYALDYQSLFGIMPYITYSFNF